MAYYKSSVEIEHIKEEGKKIIHLTFIWLS